MSARTSFVRQAADALLGPVYGTEPVKVALIAADSVSRDLIETNSPDLYSMLVAEQDRQAIDQARDEHPWGWLYFPLTIGEAKEEAQGMPKPKKRCRTCGQVIRIMIFRGTGYCSDRCRKAQGS